jgi:aryl-alcohol dehydrogenase-like predicted oxidoreductase
MKNMAWQIPEQNDNMEYIQLGRSDLVISRVGLGCMSLNPASPVSEHIIGKAIESGINYFDTADLYNKGLNEEMLGKAIRGKRQSLVIASKVGNKIRDDGNGWDWDASKAYIIEAAEKTLQRLGTDHLDLYQLHGGTLNDPIDETIDAFETLQQQGKIRYYGISSIRPNVIREWVKRSSMVSVMMQYSLLDQRPAEECLMLLKDSSIGVLARGTVAQGLLVDKPSREYLDRSAGEVELAKELIHRYSDGQRTAAQTAMQFVLHDPAVTAVVAGVSSYDQLSEAVGVFDVPRLVDDDHLVLKASVGMNKYKDHR